MDENLNRSARSHYKVERGALVPKKAFDSEMDALTTARWLNTQPNIIHKMIAYKCIKCNKWHVGSNDKVLTDKDREKAKERLKETKYRVR